MLYAQKFRSKLAPYWPRPQRMRTSKVPKENRDPAVHRAKRCV